MQIQHHKKEGHGKFFIEQDGTVIAKMTYSVPQAGQMVIRHTEVKEELRGQDLGHALVVEAVAYARQHNIKIVPVCRFAKAVFEREPDYSDVLL